MKSGGSHAPLPIGSPPWWINPAAAALAVTLPVLIASIAVSSDFQQYFDRPEKFMSPRNFMIGLLGLLAFTAGASFGSRVSLVSKPVSPSRGFLLAREPLRLSFASHIILTITLGAYVLYLSPLAFHPSFVVNILGGAQGASYLAIEMKEQVRIPGITSFTQLGILYVILLVIRTKLSYVKITFLERTALTILLLMALVRAIAYSERLAIIELLLPVLILVCRSWRSGRFLLMLLPALAPLGLFLFFASSEYIRSWQDRYQYYESDFLRFAAYRLFGYYVIALDTGAGFLEHLGGGVGPVVTLQWLWAFPLDIGQNRLLSSLGFDQAAYSSFLHYYADEEFNNASGLFGPFVDYGFVGGVAFWGFLGCLSGKLFRYYLEGSAAGLLIFPVWFLSIVDIPRVFSFTSTRYFPVFLVGVSLILWLHSGAQPARARPVPALRGGEPRVPRSTGGGSADQ